MENLGVQNYGPQGFLFRTLMHWQGLMPSKLGGREGLGPNVGRNLAVY
uniref:Uncharacterized protein n=1 Tax=Arundo donax TaxID=35708 RepID=A0A0A8YWM8_ARUDO